MKFTFYFVKFEIGKRPITKRRPDLRLCYSEVRNINKFMSLCNGNKLIVTKLGKHAIEGTEIAEKNIGLEVIISRMVNILF